jgi:hypothetical protein
VERSDVAGLSADFVFGKIQRCKRRQSAQGGALGLKR